MGMIKIKIRYALLFCLHKYFGIHYHKCTRKIHTKKNKYLCILTGQTFKG